MKIMAVDLGETRTGLATCEQMEFMASPLCVIKEEDEATLVLKIAEKAKQNGVEMIVIGYPKNMDGSCGERALKCEAISEKIAEATGLPVELWDERCTTIMAKNALNFTDTRGKKRKAIIDAVAATIILEDFINYRKNKLKQLEGN